MAASGVRRRPGMRWAGAGAVAAGLLLGACGDGTPAADRPQTLADALGFDENDFEEREAKVQEAIRRCMREQGFDYVPADPGRMNIVRIGPGSEDNEEFRRTRGYGITTGFERVEATAGEGPSSDPNDEIREGLSEEERKAYDTALFGAAATTEGPGGGFSVRVGSGARVARAGDEVQAGSAGEATPAPSPAEMGCFGKAQEEVEGGPGEIQRLGPKLQELQERIASDPRMVEANATWAACMSDAGYDFEKPEDIPPYLFEKLGELQGTPAGETGPVPPPVDSPELDALRQEELALARADDDCADTTGRGDVAKDVRQEAEARFLDENPDLGGDGDTAGGEG